MDSVNPYLNYKCIYSEYTNDCGVIVCLYVNELLIFCTDMASVLENKKYLISSFKMENLLKEI